MRNLIRKAPTWIKKPIKYVYSLIPYERRLGKVFWDTYNFLQESQWWSKEQLEEYQMRELEKLLKHAYENVPYYRRVFNERGLKPKDIQDFDDFKKLPCLTKEDVRNNLNDLMAKNLQKSMFRYVYTSGSTGIPLAFYHEKGRTAAKEWAFMVTQWNRVGYKIGDKCIVLRGHVIRPARKGKFCEYDPVNKNLFLSSFHMTDEILPEYIAKIREFKPNFIQAYPSAITILARFIKEHNIKPFLTVKAILCASENFYPWQRELLKKTMKCRIWSFYGHTEQTVLAGECEKSTCYHIFPEYGVTELISRDESPLNHEGEAGEIVGTGFNNYAMPFIRYKTGDLAVYTQQKCSCGRNYQLIEKVVGRLQEFIVAKDGHLIPLGDMQIYYVFDNIKQFQFYQDKEGEVVFKIVKKDTYTDEDTSRILRSLYNRTGGNLKVYLEFVDKILRTDSGKYRFLIQKLPIKFRE